MAEYTGQSPIRPRQLQDLRILPTADDPRPTFYFQTAPRDWADTHKTSAYPCLVWHPDTGEERTCADAAEFRAKREAGWLSVDPRIAARTALPPLLGEWQETWNTLTDAEKAALLDAQRADRLAAIQAKLASLPEEQVQNLLSVVAAATPPAAKR